MKNWLYRFAAPSDLQPGDVVSIPFGAGHVLSHYGVVTHRGTVISNSRRHGGVIEQSPEAFAAGRRLRLHGPYGDEHALSVEARARRRLGGDYDLTGSNCVHLARRAHGQRPTSLQIARATAMTLRDMVFGAR